jgi:hypothetical protein
MHKGMKDKLPDKLPVGALIVPEESCAGEILNDSDSDSDYFREDSFETFGDEEEQYHSFPFVPKENPQKGSSENLLAAAENNETEQVKKFISYISSPYDKHQTLLHYIVAHEADKEKKNRMVSLLLDASDAPIAFLDVKNKENKFLLDMAIEEQNSGLVLILRGKGFNNCSDTNNQKLEKFQAVKFSNAVGAHADVSQGVASQGVVSDEDSTGAVGSDAPRVVVLANDNADNNKKKNKFSFSFFKPMIEDLKPKPIDALLFLPALGPIGIIAFTILAIAIFVKFLHSVIIKKDTDISGNEIPKGCGYK